MGNSGSTPLSTHCWVNWSVVLGAILSFILLAGLHLSRPGLYYDELIFVNAALGGHNIAFIYRRIGSLPLMVMAYCGALKAWIYYPIFKLFGVTAFSIRAPVVALGAITLWLNYRLVKTMFSPLAALFFILMAAVEPSTLYQTRLDWGTTALMMFFRALLLLSIFTWIKSGKTWLLFAALVVSVLGVFDKLDFIWLVIAAAASLLLAYPDRLFVYAHTHRLSTIILSLLSMVFVLKLYLYMRHNLPLHKEVGVFDWASRWSQVANMLQLSLGGTGVYDFILGNGAAVGFPQIIVLAVASVVALLILAVSCRVAQEWRALGFLFFFIIFTLMQIFVTRQATGVHHTAMLVPLWLIPMAAGFAYAFGFSNSAGLFLKIPAALCAVAVGLSSLNIDAAYLRGFQQTVQNPNWDACSFGLVKATETQPNSPVVCVDWGLGNVIYGLRDGNVKLFDLWPEFVNGIKPTDEAYYEKDILPLNPLFVVRAKGKEAFPQTRVHFFDLAKNYGWQINKIYEIKNRSGESIDEIYTVSVNKPK